MKTPLLLLLATAACAAAQEPAADPYLEAESKKDAAMKAFSERLDAGLAARAEACADTNRFFVAKGVLADREKGTVEVDAFTTGTQPGSICEFYLITINSGHDYEAVFQTFALASDIAKAFEFLGVPAGSPVAYPKMRFWSAGERVAATASVDGAPARPLGAFAADAKSGASFDALQRRTAATSPADAFILQAPLPLHIRSSTSPPRRRRASSTPRRSSPPTPRSRRSSPRS